LAPQKGARPAALAPSTPPLSAKPKAPEKDTAKSASATAFKTEKSEPESARSQPSRIQTTDGESWVGWPRFPKPGKRLPLTGEKLAQQPERVVCQKRRPCRLLEKWDAGSDADGRHLQVVGISLGGASGNEKEGGEEACEPIEYWLLAGGGKEVPFAEMLLEVCNDGYGASGVGEDVIEVAPNLFSHTRYGGSSWRWTESKTLQLSPLRVAALGNESDWSLGPNRQGWHWDWNAFVGTGYAYAPECDAEGNPPEKWDDDLAVPSWVSVPVVHTPDAFQKTGWQTTSLGACAAVVGTRADAGFVVHGNHRGPEDSTMRVLGLKDGSFVVEITDDVLILQAKNRLHEDHIEIWSANGPGVDHMEHCEPKPEHKPEQWGVRLADGSVFAGFGAPATDRVQVELGPRKGGARLKIRLVDDRPLITFVYSDSDDAKTQGALIATSRLVFGDIRTLGRKHQIDPRGATCHLEAQTLVPVLK
jgi:hypothetical protein